MKIDRLSALIQRFSLDVQPCPQDQAHLIIYDFPAIAGDRFLHFASDPQNIPPLKEAAEILFCARVNIGTTDNPLKASLPPLITQLIPPDSDVDHIVCLLREENLQNRCGAPTVLNRLGEVLFIRILRHLLSQGIATTGLLAGLSDHRLSRALVAIHENPGYGWQNHHLADLAGLSLSRFSDLFRQKTGLAPMNYVRQWRMTLARQDLERGDRVQQIARRYGYQSAEALSRSFQRHFGATPQLFKSQQETASDISVTN